MGDDDPQKQPEKVTNGSYPNNISSRNTYLEAYSRLANIGTLVDALSTTLAKAAMISNGAVVTH